MCAGLSTGEGFGWHDTGGRFPLEESACHDFR